MFCRETVPYMGLYPVGLLDPTCSWSRPTGEGAGGPPTPWPRRYGPPTPGLPPPHVIGPLLPQVDLNNQLGTAPHSVLLFYKTYQQYQARGIGI